MGTGVAVVGVTDGSAAVNGVVQVDGVSVGTVVTSSGTAFRVDFNTADATLANVQRVARAVTFRNSSDLPGTQRSFTLRVTDNAGAQSAAVTKTFTVESTNDVPRITGAAASQMSASRTGAAVNPMGTIGVQLLDPFTTEGTAPNLTYLAPTNMAGGTIRMNIGTPSGSPPNRNGILLSVLGASAGNSTNLIRVSGTTISHAVVAGGVDTSSTVIGTITQFGDSSTSADLIITLNADATATRVRDLLRALRLQATSAAQTGVRPLAVWLTEPDGDTVNVLATSTTPNGRPINVT